MLDRITFVIGEAFVALRRNLAMTFAGITTGAVALFLLGLLAFAFDVVNEYTRSVPSMFDMRAFMREGSSMGEIKSTIAAVRSVGGVAEVKWIPRDKAWAKMQHDEPELTKGIDNPLPDELKVVLADIRKGDQIAAAIQGMPAVREEGVHYLRQEQKMAIAALETFQILGPELVFLLLVATGILIYNTIRLTVLSRRLEIRIMQLVGAPRMIVRVPFLIEGFIQGLVAGIFAALLLYASHELVRSQLSQQSIQFAAFPTKQALTLLSMAGGGYGLLCSIFAVRVPLTYR